jgi:hypothetical protein
MPAFVLAPREAEKIDFRSEGCMNTAAVRHIADVIGDTGTIASCLPRKSALCIVPIGKDEA